MNCTWCCKGEAQDVDLPLHCIDKLFVELSDAYIFEIRILGGEPFLKPEICNYIFDQIVERRIKLATLRIFTNSTICDDQIILGLQRLATYFSTPDSISVYDEIVTKLGDYDYGGVNKEARIRIILSTIEHYNGSLINNALLFYGGYNGIIAVAQDEFDCHKNNLILSGNALKNWKMFPVEYLNNAVARVRSYNIIYDFEDDLFLITKCLTLNARGNIMIGASMTYEEEDGDECLFGIDECCGDFYNKISDWCWNHPLPDNVHKVYAFSNAAQIKLDNGIPLTDCNKYYSNKNLLSALSSLEDCMKTIHKSMPHLGHCDVSNYVLSLFYLTYYDNPDTLKDIVELYRIIGLEKFDGSLQSKHLAEDVVRYYLRLNAKKEHKKREKRELELQHIRDKVLEKNKVYEAIWAKKENEEYRKDG